jgi:hypothetical protein
MLTESELREIEARLKATQPGPWQYDGMHNEITTPQGESYWLIVSECRKSPSEVQTDQFGHYFDANFDFIAHAPDDIRRLLDTVRELSTMKKTLERALKLACENIGLRDDIEPFSFDPAEYIEQAEKELEER